MLTYGCIAEVTQGMEKFMKIPSVLAEIIATLSNLANHKSSSKYIVSHGGCDMILKAMRIHFKEVFNVHFF
jgi:hypothetical protein